MGSGYKNFTASSVLTASDLNAYCQSQSIMYFASTTARDSAITSPLRGMTAYIASGDTNEGLYVYNGLAWRKGPGWNAPWGVISQTQAAAGAGYVTTETVVATGASATFIANRRYKWTYTTTHVGQVAGDLFQCKLRANNTSGGTYATQRFAIVGPIFQGLTTATAILAPGNSTFTPVATFERIAGTGGCGTAVEFTMVIEDIGPSGSVA